jgi:hypothetical protein
MFLELASLMDVESSVRELDMENHTSSPCYRVRTLHTSSQAILDAVERSMPLQFVRWELPMHWHSMYCSAV